MGLVLEGGCQELPERIARRLRAAKSASVLTGAGVSAESGVPPFRGAEGVWSKYDWRVLATREGFRKDPRLVWEWYPLRRTGSSMVAPAPQLPLSFS